MVCKTPQLTFFGSDSTVECGCCSGCRRAKKLAEKKRRFEWFNSRLGRSS